MKARHRGRAAEGRARKGAGAARGPAVARRPDRCRKPSGTKVYDMAKNSPTEFFQQVRAETAKVTWPSRRETLITTAMVFVMVLVASIFFLLADQVMSFGVSQLLKIGRW